MAEFIGLSGFDSLKLKPMSEEMTLLFINCMLGEKTEDTQTMSAVFDEALKHPALRIINNRLRAVNADVSPAAQLFCAAMCTTPGDAAMWAYTLNAMARTGCKRADMDMLANTFPCGFPGREELDSAWDAQKDPGSPCGNLVDSPAAYVGASTSNPDLPEEFDYLDIWSDHKDDEAIDSDLAKE